MAADLAAIPGDGPMYECRPYRTIAVAITKQAIVSPSSLATAPSPA